MCPHLYQNYFQEEHLKGPPCARIQGMKIIHRKQGYDEVTIQSDNLEIVVAISNSKLEGSNSTHIKRIQQILANEETWSLRRVPRENNRIADALAKLALLNDEELHMFDDPLWRLKRS
ncbi:hypothetical protein CXB51_001608 [Gossypium anomalum]|uniref:RNase H type-1 domain-containing protein n=1 Tax=Gossypium anomalum TaxID=47600 RepID=A0A8J6A2L2_9ROSI|nr:hypothetical protein CXB51_001608 [Gossypium anomalum]